MTWYLIKPRPGCEFATAWSKVWRPNRCATKTPKKSSTSSSGSTGQNVVKIFYWAIKRYSRPSVRLYDPYLRFTRNRNAVETSVLVKLSDTSNWDWMTIRCKFGKSLTKCQRKCRMTWVYNIWLSWTASCCRSHLVVHLLIYYNFCMVTTNHMQREGYNYSILVYLASIRFLVLPAWCYAYARCLLSKNVCPSVRQSVCHNCIKTA